MPKFAVTAGPAASTGGNASGPVLQIESMKVEEISALTATVRPITILGRVAFISGKASTYPHYRLIIEDKSGKVVVKAPACQDFASVKVDQVVEMRALTVHTAAGRDVQINPYELHFHPEVEVASGRSGKKVRMSRSRLGLQLQQAFRVFGVGISLEGGGSP